jgi:hypothetical protein
MTMTTQRKSDAEIHATMTALRSLYVTSPRDALFRARFDRLLKRGPDGEFLPEPVHFTSTRDSHGIAVTSKPGGGKTSLVKHNLRTHPAFQNPAPGTMPWIYAQVPSPATLKSLGLTILRKSGYPKQAESNPRWDAWDVVRERLGRLRTAVLWIDEVHHLLTSPKATEDVLNTIKSVMQDDTSVIVILTGIDTLWHVVASDEQVSRRMLKLRLPEVTHANDGKALHRQIEMFCAKADLDPPEEDDLEARLIHGSRGCFGLCIENMINAIETALLAGACRLEIQHFAETWAMQEGCELGKNVFLSRNWSQIDVGAPVRA